MAVTNQKKTLHLPRKVLTEVVIPREPKRDTAMGLAFATLYGKQNSKEKVNEKPR